LAAELGDRMTSKITDAEKQEIETVFYPHRVVMDCQVQEVIAFIQRRVTTNKARLWVAESVAALGPILWSPGPHRPALAVQLDIYASLPMGEPADDRLEQSIASGSAQEVQRHTDDHCDLEAIPRP
jgi:hypothetical protein